MKSDTVKGPAALPKVSWLLNKGAVVLEVSRLNSRGRWQVTSITVNPGENYTPGT